MNTYLSLLLALLVAPLSALRAAEPLLVENGQARAEIVLAAQPQRTARLAAYELQHYLAKISGATLPIVTEPTSTAPLHVYVGRSPRTDALKVTADGLKDGAYRIVSGPDWLVLIGDDTDFIPREPWAKNAGALPETQAAWDKITGAHWGIPGGGIFKARFTVPAEVIPPARDPATAKPVPWQLWGYDERGSFNAVSGFLQGLGVRWYLPGELGEVVPELKTIALPKIDQTVRPDFALRRFNFRFGTIGADTSLWAMRLGLRDPYDVQTAHGMASMTNSAEVFAAHPDWFAMYGGKRHFSSKENNQLCYSNEELFRETVRNVRLQFDTFGYTAVSVMPPDGYSAICQCPLCAGKERPERGHQGRFSDYVWDFVNRVAHEVAKTHPDRKVLNCAYGGYSLPPQQIEKLEPNVVVSIVNGRGPRNNRPEQQEEYRQLRESWVPKTANPLIDFENYPFTDRGWYLPAFTVHTLGSSVNETKGLSQGEDIWVSAKEFPTVGLGFNHFIVYFTARMYWGGKEQDVDAMFREYCRLFYGPAENEMRAFFEYGEAHWQEMEKDKLKIDRVLELFAAAQAKADPGSVYGKRIALVDDFLKGLRSKSGQLGRIRGPVPSLRLVGDPKSKIVIDGKLDDEAWEKCPGSAVVRLRELQTGRTPTFGTTVKAAWQGDSVYFAIRCEEHFGEKLNIASARKDDPALWSGDAIEVLLETDAHSYYQIAVNPAGIVSDLNRASGLNFDWESQAEVATRVEDDCWIVEMRLPVTHDDSDPLHEIIGRRPNESLPWHFNVCRQRIRDDEKELSAFSPTGTDQFHEVRKFANFFGGRSHQFEAAEPEADFLQAMNEAARLTRSDHAQAMAAFAAAAEGQATDFQKAHALEQAAQQARILRQPEAASEFARRIPLDAVKKTVLMQNLLEQGKARQVIEQFGQEKLDTWPFWQKGEAYTARGRAYAEVKAGREAEDDLLSALEFTGDPRVRESIDLLLASNRETTLKDDKRALYAYRMVLIPHPQPSGIDQLTALQGVVRILTRQGKFDEALDALKKADLDRLTGPWRGTLFLARAETVQAAGRRDEALALYRAIVADQAVEPRQRKVAEERAK